MDGRHEADVISRLNRVGTAPIADAGGRLLDRAIVALDTGLAVAGPAVPVQCAPGDNLAVQVAVARATAGSVLVIDAGGPSAPVAVWGEVLTVAAEARRIAGVVLDGATRDVDAVRARRFPLWCAARSPAGPTKVGPGQVGGTVRVGGVDVEAGDWVVADGDGVVVMPAVALPAALASAEAKAERELAWFDALRDGRDTIQLLDLDVSSIDVG